MEPTIAAEGSGYRVDWPSQGVSAQVRHIRARLDGFKAQVSIFHQGHGIHRSTPTLSSVSGMDQLTRKLNKRLPEGDYNINWEQIIEDLAGITIDTHREGTAEVALSEVPEDETVAWRVDNLLIEGNPNLIWADGGTGKSMFAVFLSVLIQEGAIDTDHGLITQPGNVLYLDWETDQFELASRARRIHRGLGIERPSGIVYRYMGQPLVEDVDRVRDIAHRREIDVVVYDSMGLAVAGEMESAENVLSFFRAVRLIDRTALIISHSNRQGTIFGSAYSMNSARSVWEAKKSSGSAGAIDFSLFHRKANNIELQAPQAWTVQFEAEQISYMRGDVYETDAAGSLSYSDLVYRILKEDGPKSKEYLEDTIAAMKEEPVERIKRNVASAVSRHKKKSTVVETQDGHLALATASQEGAWTL